MNRQYQKIVLCFLLPLYVLGVIKLVWPVRAVSAKENRSLQQMPAFSLDHLADGSFTRDFEAYYTDQFPFRDFFIQINQKARETMQLSFGQDDISLILGPGNDLGQGENIEHAETEIFASQTTATGTTDPTAATAPLDTAAETTAVAAATTAAETTAVPVETTIPVPLPGVEAPVENYSSVIIVNGAAMELYGFNQAKSDAYAQEINRLHERAPEVQLYSMLAPTSIEFNSPEKYHAMSNSQKAAIQYVYDLLSPDIRKVDTHSQLAAHWQEYIYFRTDHHWTGLGAYYGYVAFAQQAGFEPTPLESMTPGVVEGDFLGSLYKYTNSSKLAENPDHVEYWQPPVQVAGFAFDDATMTVGHKVRLLFTDIKSSNKYLAFIEGDNPLVQFKTSTANGRKIMVIKESYGNAFVPYLVNNYEEVYVLDPRKITLDLPAYLRQQGIQEVVVINYTFAVGNKTWNDGFKAIIG